jgi:hypothetical protein
MGVLVIALLAPSILGGPFPISEQASANISTALTEWPLSYIALGDSYATGNGAGKLLGNRKDKMVKHCKRFSTSYPVALNSLLPFVMDEDFHFAACSGAILANIDTMQRDRYDPRIILDAQIDSLKGSRAQLVTLSIVGNDLSLFKVVLICLYNYQIIGRKTDHTRKHECNKVLSSVEDKFDDPYVWESFRQKVKTIMNEVFAEDVNGSKNSSLLVILGYPKLFGTPEADDVCSNLRLPIHAAGIRIKTNIMYPGLRQRLNEYIEKVNDRIIKEILPLDPDRIRFVSMDDVFEGHRVCEKDFKPKTGKKYEPIGADDDNTWFYSLESKLEEKKWVFARDMDEDWRIMAGGEELMGEGENFMEEHGDEDITEEDEEEDMREEDLAIRGTAADVFGPSKLQQVSTFHPKPRANAAIAQRIFETIKQWRVDRGL